MDGICAAVSCGWSITLDQVFRPAAGRIIGSRPSRIQFSTDDLTADERQSVCEDVIRRCIGVRAIFPAGSRVRTLVDIAALSVVDAALVRTTPCIFATEPREGVDDLYVAIVRQGRLCVVHGEQMSELSPGDAAVLDARCEGELRGEEDGAILFLRLSRHSLRRLVRDADAGWDRVISRVTPALRMLTGYLETLFALDRIDDPELAGWHIADLIASTIGSSDRAPAPVTGKGLRATRLHAVQDAIARSAADSALDPARVAAQLGLSVRYVHRLLKDSGQTFSQHLLEHRLARAHRMLRDARLTDIRISQIATDAGFSDLSHFNRSFRQRFGATPTEARAGAARADDR